MTTPPTPDLGRAPADRSLSLGQRLRRRIGALGLVGTVLVVLPLTLLVRQQAAEAEALTGSRAKLDPLARAVQVQRGLMAHRDSAATWLGGNGKTDTLRRQHQDEVDARLAALMAALAAGRWELALGEADALTLDWRQLADAISQRRIDIPTSHGGHRLLVEQTLQVMDLLGTESSYSRPVALLPPQTPLAFYGTLQLAHLMGDTAALALGEAPEPALRATRALAVQRQLQRSHELHRRLVALPGRASSPGAVATASADAAERQTRLALQAWADASTPAALLAAQRDLQTAWWQQAAWFEDGWQTAHAVLQAAQRAQAQRRAALLGGLTVLLVLAIGLWWQLWRLLRQAAEADHLARGHSPWIDGGRALAARQTEPSDVEARAQATEALLQRLKASDAAEPADASAAAPPSDKAAPPAPHPWP